MCKNKDYCNVKITEARSKVLKFNQDQKSMKIQFTIYTGIGSWIEAKQSIWVIEFNQEDWLKSYIDMKRN